MIKFTAYKAPKFNNDAWAKEVRAGLKRCEAQFLKDYEATTNQWEHPVKFVVATSWDLSGSAYTQKFITEYIIRIRTEDKIWHYVNEGTRPHIITAKNAKALHFRDTYVPHTTPGSVLSGRGGASGNDVYRRQVHHPGTKARDFDRLIAEKRTKFFSAEMTSAIWKGLQAGGFVLK